MDPPIPANDMQVETVQLLVPYAILVADDWDDMVDAGGGGGGGGGGSRAWAHLS